MCDKLCEVCLIVLHVFSGLSDDDDVDNLQ